MLDFNHQPRLHERFTQVIDQALDAERAQQTPRQYLGASRLGVSCERALQFEYAGAPVEPGRGFSGRTLRIFEVGHVLEDLAIRWLRLAGFELHTRKKDGGQFGFSVANGRIQGHVDNGIFSDDYADLGLAFPMLWECKTMNDRNWKACVKSGVAVAKPVYAAQVAIYQAYMEPSIPGIADSPALFTAIIKDTQDLLVRTRPIRRRLGPADVGSCGARDSGHRSGRTAAAYRHRVQLLRVQVLLLGPSLLECLVT